jgi:succinate dehydrogenase hydrophobic anchor subunit
MMHVIRGVFDITTKAVPALTNLGPNETASAVEFVALRWNTMFAGVFIWRVYDALLLAFTVIHGFFGLRYVVNDYVGNIVVNRAMNIAIFCTALGLIIVGGLALLGTVDVATARELERAGQALIR